MRSLRCNNNPYNLDSSANWLNWNLNADLANFQAFAKSMIAFRRAHPALRPASFYSSIDNNGNVMEQLRWFKPDGSVPDGAYFDDANRHAIAWRIDGSEFGDSAAALYVAYNAWSGGVNFTLPRPGANRRGFASPTSASGLRTLTRFVRPAVKSTLASKGRTMACSGVEFCCLPSRLWSRLRVPRAIRHVNVWGMELGSRFDQSLRILSSNAVVDF